MTNCEIVGLSGAYVSDENLATSIQEIDNAESSTGIKYHLNQPVTMPSGKCGKVVGFRLAGPILGADVQFVMMDNPESPAPPATSTKFINLDQLKPIGAVEKSEPDSIADHENDLTP